jgi:GNAT superfamily N-acetyltransferase
MAQTQPLSRGTAHTAAAEVGLRPALASDAEALTVLLGGLSVRSAFQRFFAGLGHPSPRLVARLLSRETGRGAWVATHGDSVVGHVVWAVAEEPGGPTADVGVVVADAWQGNGIGGRLVHAALTEAGLAGARQVRFDVHAANRRLLTSLRRRATYVVTRDDDVITFRSPLTA